MLWMYGKSTYDSPDSYVTFIRLWGVVVSMLPPASIWWSWRLGEIVEFPFTVLTMILVYMLTLMIYEFGLLAVDSYHGKRHDGLDEFGEGGDHGYLGVMKEHGSSWWNVNPIYVLKHRHCPGLAGFEVHDDEEQYWPEDQELKGFFEMGKEFKQKPASSQFSPPSSKAGSPASASAGRRSPASAAAPQGPSSPQRLSPGGQRMVQQVVVQNGGQRRPTQVDSGSFLVPSRVQPAQAAYGARSPGSPASSGPASAAASQAAAYWVRSGGSPASSGLATTAVRPTVEPTVVPFGSSYVAAPQMRVVQPRSYVQPGAGVPSGGSVRIAPVGQTRSSTQRLVTTYGSPAAAAAAFAAFAAAAGTRGPRSPQAAAGRGGLTLPLQATTRGSAVGAVAVGGVTPQGALREPLQSSSSRSPAGARQTAVVTQAASPVGLRSPQQLLSPQPAQAASPVGLRSPQRLLTPAQVSQQRRQSPVPNTRL
mmetsp:Transcript_102752/g.329489  ORF Transcript_102752/g.329489 Transcript_102752/m.329489 type:complete len:478 (-) Transcript_102752:100-1533(-)